MIGKLRRARGTMVSLGLVCLLAAWVMATPPFGAPDEQSHYLRALTITNGRLLGPKVSYHLPGLPTPEPNWQKEELAWDDHDTRAVQVPPRLSPPAVSCLDGSPDVGARGCLEATPNGDYPPLAYLLPAVALRWAGDATTGDYLARAASAVPVLAFLILAVVLISPMGRSSLLGLLLALTPMVLFVGSVLNSSGLDIAASFACAAAAMRIAAGPERASAWVWVALAISGVVAILSWQLGPWFVLLSVALAAAIAAPQRASAVGAQRRRAIWTGLAFTAAFAVYLVYGAISGVTHGGLSFTSLGSRISGGFDQLAHGVLPDAIGRLVGGRFLFRPSATGSGGLEWSRWSRQHCGLVVRESAPCWWQLWWQH